MRTPAVPTGRVGSEVWSMPFTECLEGMLPSMHCSPFPCGLREFSLGRCCLGLGWPVNKNAKLNMQNTWVASSSSRWQLLDGYKDYAQPCCCIVKRAKLMFYKSLDFSGDHCSRMMTCSRKRKAKGSQVSALFHVDANETLTQSNLKAITHLPEYKLSKGPRPSFVNLRWTMNASIMPLPEQACLLTVQKETQQSFVGGHVLLPCAS
jgi:hypothetical protein